MGYPKKHHTDKRLYYYNIEPALLYFYSDHKISASGYDRILSLIDQSDVDQNNSFLTKDKLYYKVRDSQDLIQSPLVLDIQGSSGEWILYISRSRVDLLNIEFKEVKIRIEQLTSMSMTEPLSVEDQDELDGSWVRYYELVDKLTEYGHPPF